MSQTIICPHCQKQISLDAALTHQIEEQLKAEFEEKRKQDKQQMWVIAQQKALEKIKTEQSNELKLVQEELTEEKKRNQEFISQITQLNRLLRELKHKDEEREMQIEKQLLEEREEIRQKTLTEFSEQYKLKEKEKDQMINQLKGALEDARRKAEQGSQQLQGEVLELEIEAVLKNEFPYDQITPVAKGTLGADIIQVVNDTNGRLCGSIAWESKRTKTWQDNWIEKLKNDQRIAKAEAAVLVTQALPKNIKHFDNKEGIFICDYAAFISLAKILRSSLIQLATVKLAHIGKHEKMEILWNYLTGIEFRQRMEVIIDSFNSMKTDLEKEKQAYQKIWAKREKQIQQVLDNTIGLRGDLEGVMGNALPEMKELELTPLPQQEELVEELL